MRCSDLVPESAYEGQTAETSDVVGSGGAVTCSVLGATGAAVFLRRSDVTVAASLLRQLGTTPRCHFPGSV